MGMKTARKVKEGRMGWDKRGKTEKEKKENEQKKEKEEDKGKKKQMTIEIKEKVLATKF